MLESHHHPCMLHCGDIAIVVCIYRAQVAICSGTIPYWQLLLSVADRGAGDGE